MTSHNPSTKNESVHKVDEMLHLPSESNLHDSLPYREILEKQPRPYVKENPPFSRETRLEMLLELQEWCEQKWPGTKWRRKK